MKKEIHIILVYNSAYYVKDKIIEDIKSKFNIVDIVEVMWDLDKFNKNLHRFYSKSMSKFDDQKRLQIIHGKEEHIGRGPFTVIVFEDGNPVYEKRDTTDGLVEVNSNVFDLKTIYRGWSGGGHSSRIHGTNSIKEVNHDLTLLFGKNADDFIEDRDEWDGTIKQYKNNIVADGGFEDINQLFYVLNNTIDYVVLRNFECIPSEYTMEGHGDIDLMVSSYIETQLVTDSYPHDKEPWRILNVVKIGGENVLMDFRYVSDGYYDIKWQKDIMDTRIFERCFYRPTNINYFYSLLYHAIVHKAYIKDDYVTNLLSMSKELDISTFNIEVLKDRFKLKRFMDNYMSEMGYNYSQPIDLSVYYNPHIASVTFDSKYDIGVYDNNFISKVNELDNTHLDNFRLIESKSDSLVLINDYDNTVLKHIKLYHEFNPIQREVDSLNKLKDFDRVPKVIGYNEENLMTSYVGAPLSNLNLPGDWKEQVDYICDSLEKYNCSHNDIKTSDILVLDGKLHIVDFQWSTNFGEEIPEHFPKGLGGQYRLGFYDEEMKFSDKFSLYFSIMSVLEDVDTDDNNQAKPLHDRVRMMLNL